MKKSSSFNVLLGEGTLQSRWRQNAGASFIRIRKNKFRSSFIYLILFILIVLVIYISVPVSRQHYNFNASLKHLQQNPTHSNPSIVNYNTKYPLTNPITNVHEKTVTWKIGLIADLDTNSRTKRDGEFVSYIKRGWLTISQTHTSFDFKFDVDSKEIMSGYALKGIIIDLYYFDY